MSRGRRGHHRWLPHLCRYLSVELRFQEAAIRSLIAFLALPGVVAFGVPLFVLRPPAPRAPFTPLGAVVVGVGMVIVVWCVRDFHVLGRGTLAPWSPPQRLVVRGLYRYSRNPMYLGVLVIVGGWALGFGSWPIAAYAAALATAFHLRVVLGEEPWLARTHGAEWSAYASAVPRWFGMRGQRGATTGGE